MVDKIIPIKTGNAEKDAQIERLTELKQQPDVNIISIIEGRAQDIEKTGFPTQSVKVPKQEAYVVVKKIATIRQKIYESPYFLLASQGKIMLENTPGYELDEDTTKSMPSPNNPDITIYDEYMALKRAVKEYQKELEAMCMTYLFRGLKSDLYIEIPETIAKKQDALNKQREKPDGEDAELPYRDSWWVQLAASSIVCYQDGDTIVNQEELTFEEWLDHFEGLDKFMQMGISNRKDEKGNMIPFVITKCLSELLLSASDFELAMMDLSF